MGISSLLDSPLAWRQAVEGIEAVPSGPDWLQEVKYDGYWLRLERDGDRVRPDHPGGGP